MVSVDNFDEEPSVQFAFRLMFLVLWFIDNQAWKVVLQNLGKIRDII